MTRSPTVRFLLGLLVTLGAVTGLSSYSLYRLHGLRKVELNIVDLNRHEALQLLRVQNDLNAIGLKLRDMASDLDQSQLRHYKQEFSMLRLDLQRALRYETRLVPVTQPAGDGEDMAAILGRFWDSSDEVFEEAAAGRNAQARKLSGTTLSQLQAEMSTRVSALLERNNAAEEEADKRIADIYESAEKDTYMFLAMTMLGIAATSLYLIYWNRKFFWQLESLSRQRRVLAARLISVQEEVLRSVSRELHDEFGQILTAVGAMLARAEKKGVPPDSPLRTELSEVREITHGTLEKIRSLSQMLHPAVIDDYGLEKAVAWYAEVFERQNGITTTVLIQGEPIRITGEPAIHCFRIVQEALTNAAKHSGSQRAEVSMAFGRTDLRVMIRDFGRGVIADKKKRGSGLGLIAMRERAELIGGVLKVDSAPGGGTTISVVMPLKQDDSAADEIRDMSEDEVVI
ncbi:MAG TPA: sensor histidine kinase [Bryobacteraceae bacterium]|jgi:signal transduction histidine kinase|nr:sensor histidine kinase [Bryobacteraceae bacterium]